MSQVIIYKQENGVPSIIIPSPEALKFYSIEQIAIKDVPAGKKFKIIDAADLQIVSDYPQEAWTVDEADVTDGTGRKLNEFN